MDLNEPEMRAPTLWQRIRHLLLLHPKMLEVMLESPQFQSSHVRGPLGSARARDVLWLQGSVGDLTPSTTLELDDIDSEPPTDDRIHTHTQDDKTKKHPPDVGKKQLRLYRSDLTPQPQSWRPDSRTWAWQGSYFTSSRKVALLLAHQSIQTVHERCLQTRINLWRKPLSFTWSEKKEFHGIILVESQW